MCEEQRDALFCPRVGAGPEPTHPEIPPNCDLIYESEAKKGPYWVINNMCQTSICLVDTDPDDRKIIAAVARCAWMDMPHDHKLAMDYVPTAYHTSDDSLAEAWEHLKKYNAEAWRIWGNRNAAFDKSEICAARIKEVSL